MDKDKLPIISIVLLGVITVACLFAELIMTHDPTYLDVAHYNLAPNRSFLFGTDSMGRDVFSMIWYGGRVSLIVGVLSTMISTIIAIIYGAISGMANQFVDQILMRFLEIILSIPSILLIIFLQAILGARNIWSITIVIGITNWMMMAKIVRTEVKQIRQSDYVVISQCMGGNFGFVLKRHLMPNFISSIMFMIVMNIRNGIIAEATLSFLGIGLPIEIISWGSMLSLSEKALMSNAWWVILIPGAFIVVTLVCVTNIGHYYSNTVNQKGVLL